MFHYYPRLCAFEVSRLQEDLLTLRMITQSKFIKYTLSACLSPNIIVAFVCVNIEKVSIAHSTSLCALR